MFDITKMGKKEGQLGEHLAREMIWSFVNEPLWTLEGFYNIVVLRDSWCYKFQMQLKDVEVERLCCMLRFLLCLYKLVLFIVFHPNMNLQGKVALLFSFLKFSYACA